MSKRLDDIKRQIDILGSKREDAVDIDSLDLRDVGGDAKTKVTAAIRDSKIHADLHDGVYKNGVVSVYVRLTYTGLIYRDGRVTAVKEKVYDLPIAGKDERTVAKLKSRFEANVLRKAKDDAARISSQYASHPIKVNPNGHKEREAKLQRGY